MKTLREMINIVEDAQVNELLDKPAKVKGYWGRQKCRSRFLCL
jgi:hypothetical protein